MAGNIYGYQGVHTPLESITQGRYTLSDYTQMRTELGARLQALENIGGFIPNDVVITGFLNVEPGPNGAGQIVSTSSITGESLQIALQANCGNIVCNNTLVVGSTISSVGSMAVGGNLQVTGAISGESLNVPHQATCGNIVCNTSLVVGSTISTVGGMAVGGNLQVTGVISGNGSGITGVTATVISTFISKDQGLNENYSPPSNTTKQTTLALQYTNACTVSLANFSVSPALFPDGIRYFTIIKGANPTAPYTVTITPPLGYTFFSPSGANIASYSMGVTTYSLTMVIWTNYRIYVTCIS